ncbi:MAG: DUF393 domain-containing protein [Lentimicrobium sp.]|nr:DUF393 domain-containing protein [Lentimicrobium sp.]
MKYSPETHAKLIENLETGKGIIVFDGECVLCNASIRYLLKLDKEKRLFYTTFNSTFIEQAGIGLTIGAEPQSLIFIDHKGIYTESSAVLEVAGLTRAFSLLRPIAILIPEAFRNYIYRVIASHRFRWFGRTKQCFVPLPADANRFLK